MARILVRFIVMAIVLWAGPAVAVVVAQPDDNIPGKADLIAFFNTHSGHGRVGWSALRQGGGQVNVALDCATDG